MDDRNINQKEKQQDTENINCHYSCNLKYFSQLNPTKVNNTLAKGISVSKSFEYASISNYWPRKTGIKFEKKR